MRALRLCLDGTQGLGAALCYVFVMRQPREVRPTSGVSWHIWLAPASASELQPGLGLARPGLQSSPTRRGVKPCSLTSPKRDWVSTCPSPSSRAPAAYGWRLLSLSTEDSFGTPSGSVCTLYECLGPYTDGCVFDIWRATGWSFSTLLFDSSCGRWLTLCPTGCVNCWQRGGLASV